MQPLALTRGLAHAARAAGARIFAPARATKMERRDQRWHLNVSGKAVKADKVILAPNGYTDGLLSGLKRSVLKLRPIQIATDPLPSEEISEILPKGHTISDSRRLIMYARREPDDRIVFGGSG